MREILREASPPWLIVEGALAATGVTFAIIGGSDISAQSEQVNSGVYAQAQLEAHPQAMTNEANKQLEAAGRESMSTDQLKDNARNFTEIARRDRKLDITGLIGGSGAAALALGAATWSLCDAARKVTTRRYLQTIPPSTWQPRQ